MTESKGLWIRPYNGKSAAAELVKIDKEHDLALLYVKDKMVHPYVKLATGVRLGEKVINIGSPLFFEFLVSDGIVAQIDVKIKEFKSHYLVTTAMINSGSSGGGAFNVKGELLGVNTLSVGIFGWSGISMAVSIADIEAFLK